MRTSPLLVLILALSLCSLSPAQEEGSPAGSGALDAPIEVPPILGALYFDAWSIEKEVIAQPLALQGLIDLGLAPGMMLDVSKRAEVAARVTEFLKGRCPLTVDGELLEFEPDRAQFIEPDPVNYTPIEDEAVIPVEEATLSVVFVAPLPSLDGAVNLRWDLFTEEVSSVRVVAVDIVGSRVFEVSEAKPSFSVLGRFPVGAREAPEPPPAPAAANRQLPWLSLLLVVLVIPVAIGIVRSERKRGSLVVVLVVLIAGAAVARKFVTIPIAGGEPEAVDAEEGTLIVDRLLRGVYHAFDFRDESARYDILDRVAGGEALTPIYLEVSRTLEQRQEDGSRVRVHDLQVKEASPVALDGRRGFATECDWEVSGKVGHWGHFHDRTNRYRARLTIEPLDESWKITGLTLLTRDRQVDEES